jgi:hypothetical protein
MCVAEGHMKLYLSMPLPKMFGEYHIGFLLESDQTYGFRQNQTIMMHWN